MEVVILQIFNIKDDNGDLESRSAIFTISDGQDTYLYRRGAIPPDFTHANVLAWLESHSDELYAEAVAHGQAVGHLIDTPNIDLQRLIKALGLVLRDRDEYIINAINALADFLGVPDVNRPEPVTPQQVYDAVRARYIELD